MIQFTAEIEKFGKMGEKTGWSYVFIPSTLAQQIKPDCKKSFRLKGKIDEVEFRGKAMVPMGKGDFIFTLNDVLRKKLKKDVGAKVLLSVEEDCNFKIEIPEDLALCLLDEKHLMSNFLTMPVSHQNYYINWINQAKTESIRTKRITMTIIAMDKQQDFGTMIRESKKKQ